MDKEKKLLSLDIQFFGRTKNALTEHYLAKYDEDTSSEDIEWLKLENWISSIGDESDEEVEEQAFYSGDGTPESDVISVKKNHEVEGMYDDSDPAHKFIREKEFETGEGRKCLYKQVRTNGDELVGPATLTDIVTTGGEAQEYAPLGCTISWDRKPEITKADDGEGTP